MAMLQLSPMNITKFVKLAGAQEILIHMPCVLSVICHARLSFHLAFKALGRPAEQWIFGECVKGDKTLCAPQICGVSLQAGKIFRKNIPRYARDNSPILQKGASAATTQDVSILHSFARKGTIVHNQTTTSTNHHQHHHNEHRYCAVKATAALSSIASSSNAAAATTEPSATAHHRSRTSKTTVA